MGAVENAVGSEQTWEKRHRVKWHRFALKLRHTSKDLEGAVAGAGCLPGRFVSISPGVPSHNFTWSMEPLNTRARFRDCGGANPVIEHQFGSLHLTILQDFGRWSAAAAATTSRSGDDGPPAGAAAAD